MIDSNRIFEMHKLVVGMKFLTRKFGHFKQSSFKQVKKRNQIDSEQLNKELDKTGRNHLNWIRMTFDHRQNETIPEKNRRIFELKNGNIRIMSNSKVRIPREEKSAFKIVRSGFFCACIFLLSSSFQAFSHKKIRKFRKSNSELASYQHFQTSIWEKHIKIAILIAFLCDRTKQRSISQIDPKKHQNF